ncbi:hypothetical protein BT63DRAFT_419930 [Microthyrium microscopicum]|uniref:TLC domain-containing protein n=1 Tax=Microthyrium microscopicum TaxID=703497 RepID=A0A6A6UQT6_9PEZI|nr:hypothetical protein BT63DRAFT_419930 [Microthyrium microscopicum]
MLDPYPLPNPPWLRELVTPLAKRAGLHTLPDHIHQVLLAFAIYQATLLWISPLITKIFFAESYAKLSKRTQFNWHVHAVAFIQAIIISGVALWVLAKEQERPHMNWQERIYGYTGALGMVQAFGAGYFVWDLYICIRYYSMFGFGMLAHAISALTVYTTGFYPFVNFYAPVFVLYEISSPFLNIHWFCDKMELTGSNIQFINGILLLITFGGARLIYGTWASYSLCRDILTAVYTAREAPHTPPLALSHFALNATTLFNNPIEALQVLKYAPAGPHIPTWMWMSNIASNITLNILNWYWYQQMISAIRKRFDPPFGTRKKLKADSDIKVTRSEDASGSKTLKVDSLEVRRRQQLERLESTGMIP